MKDLVVRKAKKSDMKEVLSMIIELAKFEKSENEVQTTVKQLQKDGFGENNYFDVLIICFSIFLFCFTKKKLYT